MLELRVDFLLSGCRSLKEKRQRLRGLRDRFGRHSALAVVERDYADELGRAQWSFIGAASAAEPVFAQLADVERYLTLSVDAEIVGIQRVELVGTDDLEWPMR